ncbi:hypothetical protein KIN20_034031 [Parelaphostrongylus tenuis]|uniref:protein-serine/threonine phosphatase n=1 Tax=Parelaphostrongylus tenuis TaxID=148309 RepID=A0AAD5R9R5_PARTN|nr:hypothetical protein KIN20_034031 [Parelaphostrongylus tenuis]
MCGFMEIWMEIMHRPMLSTAFNTYFQKQMPNHVYLLRGASEVYPMNIEGRFSRRVTRCLEGVIQRACGYLPLAATVADTIFCCHGARGRRFNPMIDQTETILKTLGMEMLVRSRNPVKQGYQSFGPQTLSIWSSPGESNCKAGAAIHVNCSKVITIVKMAEYGTFSPDQLASASQNKAAEALLPMNKDRERRRKRERKEGRRDDAHSPNRET